jgi:hypothetical protein
MYAPAPDAFKNLIIHQLSMMLMIASSSSSSSNPHLKAKLAA